MTTTTTNISPNLEQAEPILRRKKIRRIIAVAAGLFVLLVVALIAWMSYVPADLDTSTTLMSAQGLYEISYTSDLGSVPINQIQSWTLHIETADGRPVENATINVDGDMPQHGHGLPTQPQVTQYLGNGDYKVEGLKFHMPGWWVMDFVVTAEGQTDQVRFNMVLK